MPPRRTCECMACDKCRHREERRRVYRLRTYGMWEPRGDLGQVSRHLEYLRSHRVGLVRIHDLTGISTSTLSRIRAGKNQWVSKAVADAILSVQPQSTLRLNPLGVSRRIRALMALGWSTYYIAERLEKQQANVWELSKGRRWVTQETFDVVAALYDELSMAPGPSSITRARAHRAGHLPPLAWDDIDDPDERPDLRSWRPRRTTSSLERDDYDEVVVLRLLNQDTTVVSTKAERVEAMRRWLSWGKSEKELCRIHGWKDGRYVTRQETAA